jgi:hypothetical protein
MQKILIALLGVGIIGLGVFSFLLLRSAPTDPAVTTSEDATAITEEEKSATTTFTGTGSMQSLLSRTEELECSISYQEASSTREVSGTYFTSNGRLRGDFILPELGPEGVSSMILRDNTLYSWTMVEGEGYGMQISLEDLASTRSDESAPDTNEPVPLDIPVMYACKTWTAKDDSIFELPEEVVFRDYASLMDVGMQYGTVYEESPIELGASPCELCAQVPAGEGQNECKARFQCE